MDLTHQFKCIDTSFLSTWTLVEKACSQTVMDSALGGGHIGMRDPL